MKPTSDKLTSLPSRPGVYLMRDKAGKVVYVGKAKDVRARVRSYFNNSDERSQIQFLLGRVEDIETLVTPMPRDRSIAPPAASTRSFNDLGMRCPVSVRG